MSSRDQTCNVGTGLPELGLITPPCGVPRIRSAFVPSIVFHWRRQPPFYVERRPFARHVLPNSPQEKFVVNVVEQAFDVEL